MPDPSPAQSTPDDEAEPTSAEASSPAPEPEAPAQPAAVAGPAAVGPGEAIAAAGRASPYQHWLKIRGQLDSTTALGLALLGVVMFLLGWGFLTHSSYELHPLTGVVGEDGLVVAEGLTLGEESEVASRSRRLQRYEPDDPAVDLAALELAPNEFVVLSKAPLTLRYHPRLAGEEVGFSYSTGTGPIVIPFLVPPPGEVLAAFKALLVGPSYQVQCPNADCPSREAGDGFVIVSSAQGEALEAFKQSRMSGGTEIPAPNVTCPLDQAVLDAEPAIALPGREFRKGALATVRRTLLGFLAAILVCFPLGVAAGAFPQVKRFISPLEIGGGYTPPVALLPLVSVVNMILADSGFSTVFAADGARIGFIVTITAFWLYPAIVAQVEAVDDVFVNTAYTCGASRWQVVRHVLIPVSMAEIWESFRVSYGIGWALIILAEGYALSRLPGEYGLGFFLVLMQRRREMGNFFATVFLIILMAMVFDFLFRALGRKLFPYREVD